MAMPLGAQRIRRVETGIVQRQIHMRGEQYERLRLEAFKQRRTMSSLIREALDKFFNDDATVP